MKRWPILCLAWAATCCSDIPKDPEGTLDRVRAERRFQVGIIAAGGSRIGLDRQVLMLRRVSEATGADPILQTGASGPLLTRLEEGELDIVIGQFAPASPWGKKVTLLPPIGEQVSRDGHILLTVAARNGENAWIGLLHREARAVAAKP